jgi:ABC-type Fe3+ transport system substrate-binding protein
MNRGLKNCALALELLLASATMLNAAVSVGLNEAKENAEARGYTFVRSRDEILAQAKKEGKLKATSSLRDALKPMARAFKQKYPFIDIDAQELEGADANHRFLLEIKAGWARVDANRVFTELYEEFLPYQKKFDIFGMAQHKILDIPNKMIDPDHRNVVAVGSQLHVVAYNKTLISPDKVPDRWEDFLKPEFKGKKFATDMRPIAVASLVSAWGLDKTVEFARKIAAQDPVWTRGYTRSLVSVTTGEIPLALGTYLGNTKRAQEKDRAAILGYKILEPVAARLYLTKSVLATAQHPYAALLWLEFQASGEGQKILDKDWPFGASVLSPDSVQAKEVLQKPLYLIDWNHYTKLDNYVAKVVEAYGFPKVERK